MQKEQLATVQAEWQAALDDVGFEVRRARLYPFPGEESEAGNRAYYFTPVSACATRLTFLMRLADSSRTRTSTRRDCLHGHP